VKGKNIVGGVRSRSVLLQRLCVNSLVVEDKE
jgi:hypothetical protein